MLAHTRQPLIGFARSGDSVVVAVPTLSMALRSDWDSYWASFAARGTLVPYLPDSQDAAVAAPAVSLSLSLGRGLNPGWRPVSSYKIN